jgi:hypothetical protein
LIDEYWQVGVNGQPAFNSNGGVGANGVQSNSALNVPTGASPGASGPAASPDASGPAASPGASGSAASPGGSGPTAPVNNYDFHAYCCYWAKTGECSKNASFMFIFCKASCGVTCTGKCLILNTVEISTMFFHPLDNSENRNSMIPFKYHRWHMLGQSIGGVLGQCAAQPRSVSILANTLNAHLRHIC